MSPRTAAARVVGPRTGATARTTADRGRPAPAPAAGRPDLRIVPSGPVVRAGLRAAAAHGERRKPFVLLVVFLLLGTTLALLVLNTLINVNSIDASTLRRHNAELAERVQTLQQRVVANGTPAELAAAATAAGLVPAGSAAYLVIAPDGSSTLRGSVTPAPQPPKPRRVAADKD